MRRSFASDSFYRSIFTEYTQQILNLGERPIEFFLEGTRSRCGKALQPKLGMKLVIFVLAVQSTIDISNSQGTRKKVRDIASSR